MAENPWLPHNPRIKGKILTLTTNKKSVQQSNSRQYKPNTPGKHRNIPSDAYLLKLKKWVRRTINEAEKNGDTDKRNRFLALKAELL